MDSRADMLYSFLDLIRCHCLYLVGDVIDIWALRKKWHWPKQYNEVLHKLLKRSRKGAKVVFIPGNKDDFFRHFIGYRFGDVRIAEMATHRTADGKRFLVMHGHEFDPVVLYRPWLSHLGSWAYRYVITLNRLFNFFGRIMGRPYLSFSGMIKRKAQAAAKHLTNFGDLLTREARNRKVDGVICGHTRQPAMHEVAGLVYCSTGDREEHCTALVEHESGELELVHWPSFLEQHERQAEFKPQEPLPAENSTSPEAALAPGIHAKDLAGCDAPAALP
jgi:UDP-2,3-diacylglucosamine pyrophosphatase LpxH